MTHLPCPARNQESVHSSNKRCDRRDPDASARRVRLPTVGAPAGFDERNLLAGAKPMSIATARTPQPSRPSATDQCARRCMPEAQGMVAGRYACRGAVGPSPASVTSWLMRTVNHEVAQGMSCTQHDTPVRLTSRMPCTRTRPRLPILTAIHDLHVWSLTTGKDVLSVHVVTDGVREEHEMLSDIQGAVNSFGLHHSTVQIEAQWLECRTSEHARGGAESDR